MPTDRRGWHRKAACAQRGWDLFFEGSLTDGNKLRATNDHVQLREEFCARCPVRWQCLQDAMEQEGSAGSGYRFGIWGGLTPLQRHSLKQRGCWKCPKCDETFDPMGFLVGELVCDNCGYEATVKPLPDCGDSWLERHTKLAEQVVAWLIENTVVGAVVPRPHGLARTLSARKADVVRVYEALVFDGTLARTADGAYVRKSKTAAMKQWRPPHVAT
jgi:hypothetical protein